MRYTLTKFQVLSAIALLAWIVGCDREAKNRQMSATAPSTADAPVTEDQRLSQLLLGWWESKVDDTVTTEAFLANGTSTGTVTSTLDGAPHVVSLTCTWRIEGKKIHEKVTESTWAFFPVGTTWADEIVTLDSEKLVTRTESGKLETRRRVTK